MDSRMMGELIDKYLNYLVVNKQKLYYVLFYFQPAGRKSMDDFFINFNKTLESNLPDHRSDLHLYYLTTANDKSIRKQIEDALIQVLKKIDLN